MLDLCSELRISVNELLSGEMIKMNNYNEKAEQLQKALDVCGLYEKKLVLTGRETGATGSEYADYVMETLSNPDLDTIYAKFI